MLPLFLLEFVNDVFHILLNLSLLFYLTSFRSVLGQLHLSFSFFLAEKHLKMIKLCRQQMASNRWYFVGV